MSGRNQTNKAKPLSAADGGDRCIACFRSGMADPPRATCRGNCSACSTALRRRIKRGELTEAEALSQGLLLPPGKRGRKPTAPMHSAIDRELNAGK